MVKAIFEDSKQMIPCCAYLTGQYGIENVYCGVPARLGRGGVKEVVEMDLTPEQKLALQTSAEHVRENCSKLSLS